MVTYPLKRPRATLRRFIKNRRGATMVEYAVLLVLILVAAAATFKQLGNTVKDKTKAAGTYL
jgi:Flp pilus assembly pilin Flp